MKAKSILFISILLSTLFSVTSCSDKDDDKGGKGDKSENQVINEWIHKDMSTNYFWNEQMTKSTALNFNDNPITFFYNTLYTHDKFSSLEYDGTTKGKEDKAAISKTIHNEIGFEFQAFIDSKGVIELLVTYVKKGTEAEKQKLMRGDWIVTVDGATINEGNFRSILYTGKASYKLTLKNKDPLTLKATPTHDENPVYTSGILPAGNKKVGYILYNSFANGKDDDSYDYAIEMNNILKSFEGKVDELILDLRYNGGGLVQSGTYIASAIAKGITPNRTSKIYTRRNYNSTLEKIASYRNSKNNYFYDEITDGRTKHAIAQLNLQRLYVITSQQTASASEQIINGLRAYMTVEVVGETTVGKNMESFSITGKDEASKWVLHPLTSISYRSDKDVERNDYSKGFPPTVSWHGINGEGKVGVHLENDEFQTLREVGEFFPLGDLQETLLSKTLEHISGVKKPTPRMLKKPNVLNSVGSSLERKRQEMIISFDE